MGEWKNGLFGCFGDLKVCLLSYFVGPFVHAKNAEAVGENCLLCGLVMFVPLANIWFLTQIRGKIREANGIEGTLVKDLMINCCCPCCSIAQQAQEVNSLDSLGMAQSMARE